MNKREKEIQQVFLDNEKAVLKNLEEAYEDALAEINSKIELLLARQDADMQHVIYQMEYQKALKTQVQSILENLQNSEFETVSDYLTKSYQDGYIGTLYNIQGQGIPLVFPIDQKAVVDAIQTETKLSETLYSALGKDIKALQKNIAGEISRGISTGMMYSDIARNVSNYARIPKNNAMRIVRTEAHRIQTKAGMDACVKAKEKGADVIKQWDSSLDKRTRDSHVKLDGERRELDEPFSNGLMYAGDPSGRAEEVINCRCAILQRARWALDRDETKHLGDMSSRTDEELEPLAKKLHMDVDELRSHKDEIVPINAKSYSDFKDKYNKLWKYEGSEVQARAEARIAGYGAERVRSSAQKMKAGYTEEGALVSKITQAIIDKVKLKSLSGLSASELQTFENAHKRVLEVSMKENASKEVALMLGKNMEDIGTVFGTATELDLNVSGRSLAKYVIHNHPNNSSFSNKDVAWLLNNENVKYFSIVKNNGSVETLIKTDQFNPSVLKVEFGRIVKKYQKDIENNEQKGYSMVVEKLLQKTKSGLIYER